MKFKEQQINNPHANSSSTELMKVIHHHLQNSSELDYAGNI